MKKLLPIMIAIAMLTVCLVSLDTVDTDAEDIDIGFWVNNEKINKDADASGNGWKYEKATNTLTLTGGKFSTNHDDTYNFGDPYFGSYQRSSPIYYGYDDTLKIVLLGLIAFMVGTWAGVMFGKIMCIATGGKVNPLIGSAGVSAVPMAARVSQKVGAEYDPTNFLLMHAMGPNVAGVVGTAVAAGTFMAIFGI